MALVPLYAQPGICKVNSQYASGQTSAGVRDRAARGRYVDCDHVRFVAGFPEKIGGWEFATEDTMTGIPRVICDWRDQNSAARLGIGTESHLYYFDGVDIVDITPLATIASGTLTDPISTTIGSTQVLIADATQNLQNGDYVFLDATSAVGGVDVNGWYQVNSRSGTGYGITVPTAATSSAGPGGGATTYEYPRRTLTNPFATVSGSPTVTITQSSHGAFTGDYATFSGASTVAGLDLNGEWQITVTGSNTYTITALSNANATVAAGGGSVSVTIDIHVDQLEFAYAIPYGSGPYGVGPYGFTTMPTAAQPSGWTLAAYGMTLLANPIGGTIYIYNPVTGGRAYPVLNAPETVLAMFVTPERFVFALGIDGNPMQIAWPDQDDITNWTTTPTNTANSGRSFQGGNFFVGGIPVANGVSLFFSNRAAFEASYTGDNTIYNTPVVSDRAGLIGPQAMTTMGGVAFWMSDRDFWMWNGAVTALPSDDIRDFVFDNLTTLYQSRCVVGTVAEKKEVWFFYPANESQDINRYVIYHTDQGVWSVGTMARTAWYDSDLFSHPYGCNDNGELFQHETGVNQPDGIPLGANIQYAPADISDGNVNMDIFGFLPDFERIEQNITLTVSTKYYPMETATNHGPFVIADDGSTPLLDFRADGKMVGYTLTSLSLDCDFRLGVPRANVQPAGARL